MRPHRAPTTRPVARPAHRTRRRVAVAGLAVALGVATACGPDTTTTPTTGDARIDGDIAEVVATEDRGTLFVGTSSGVAAVDTSGGGVEWSMSPATPSPDWGTLVTTSIAPGASGAPRTTVSALSPADQSIRWSAEVDGDLAVRQVAAGGDAAVLLPPAQGAYAGTLPVEARERTTMVIVRADGSEQRLELDGNIEPEAFAADASGLFVVQYAPAMAPDRYRVRWLDLASGEIRDAVDAHGALQADMPGTARTQVRSPDGLRLYTYYAVPAAPEAGRPSYAFVHVLDLEEGWAHCLDLPAPWGAGSQGAVGVAVSPDGNDLYVTDQELGLVSVADTDALTVERTTEVDPRSPDLTHATVGADGRLYVSVGSSVAVHEPEGLTVVDTWQTPAVVTGLDTSPDGDELFVSHPPSVSGEAAIDVIDTRTGDEARTLEPALPDTIVYLGRDRPPLPYGSKECAC